MKKEATEVVVQLTPIAEYSKTAAALAELSQKYKGVLFDVQTREGMQAAIKGRAELRGYRVALEKREWKSRLLRSSAPKRSTAKRGASRQNCSHSKLL